MGLAAALSCWLMGAGRVIVVDHLDYRLRKAESFAFAEPINFGEVDDIVRRLKNYPRVGLARQFGVKRRFGRGDARYMVKEEGLHKRDA